MARIPNTNPDETRAHILAIARQEFFRVGYSGASINVIVEATKFSKPTIYYHFKSKAELFAALVREAYDHCYEHRRQAVKVTAPAAQQMRQAIQADFEFCLKFPEEVRFALAYTFTLRDEHPIDLTDIHNRDYQFFCDLMKRGVERRELVCADYTEAAITLQGVITINMMSYLKMGASPEFLSPQRAKDITALLLKGLQAKPRSRNKKQKKGSST